MKCVFVLLILWTLPTWATGPAAKKKVQEVNFEGSDVDGQVHNPDGALLVQKRGVKFVPMYKVKEHFDESIKDSVEYL